MISSKIKRIFFIIYNISVELSPFPKSSTLRSTKQPKTNTAWRVLTAIGKMLHSRRANFELLTMTVTTPTQWQCVSLNKTWWLVNLAVCGQVMCHQWHTTKWKIASKLLCGGKYLGNIHSFSKIIRSNVCLCTYRKWLLKCVACLCGSQRDLADNSLQFSSFLCE